MKITRRFNDKNREIVMKETNFSSWANFSKFPLHFLKKFTHLGVLTSKKLQSTCLRVIFLYILIASILLFRLVKTTALYLVPVESYSIYSQVSSIFKWILVFIHSRFDKKIDLLVCWLTNIQYFSSRFPDTALHIVMIMSFRIPNETLPISLFFSITIFGVKRITDTRIYVQCP
jgi:hypothetical protein